MERQAATVVVDEQPAQTDLGGRLPGDKDEGLYWEARIATWLGLPRPRLARLRKRALREGEHWLVMQQEIVFTAAGIQQVRDLLSSLGELKPRTEEAAEDPQAPAGPPEKALAVVVKLFPNTQLMQAKVGEELGLVRVRDNRNFMAGMKVAVVRAPQNRLWQYTGRLPRSRGRM